MSGYLTRRRLSPQQADLLDALRCMEWCDAPDLMEAANIPTVNTLRVIMTKLRIAGYDIANRKASKRRGRVCAYSLRGEP